MIHVEHLFKSFRDPRRGIVHAVEDVSFDTRAGEIFGLLGPNGAGKTTTLRILCTVLKPTAGRATVAGFDVAENPLAARGVSSVVFQEPVVDRSLSGRANLELHARLWRVEPGVARQRIAELSDALGVADLLDRAVGDYSGGERRRLEIARALVSEPRVVFLDEPTVGLDPRIRHELLEVIGRLRAGTDLTILLTTHYLDEAERLCDRIAVMHEGRIVALDHPQRLRHELGRELVELHVRDDLPAALAVLRAHGIPAEDAFSVGSTLTVPLRDLSAGEAIATINDLGLATAISAREPTLDDVYLRLTGDRLAPAA